MSAVLASSISVDAGGLFVGFLLGAGLILLTWYIVVHEGNGPRWLYPVSIVVGVILFLVLGFDLYLSD